jgi:outer membrane protein
VKYLRSLAFLPLLAATPAFAQEETPGPAPQVDPEKLDGDSMTIGVLAALSPSYDGSDDTVWSAMPLVRGRLGRVNFVVRGNKFTADVIPTPGGPGWDVQVGPVGQFNFNRSAAIKDPQVKALGRLETAIEVGGYVGIGRTGLITSDYDKLTVSVGYVRDIAKVHRSYVITPSIDYATPLSRKALVGINFSANYVGDGYADTYFSVTPIGTVRSGLPTFTARKGWKDWTLSGLGAVSLTGDLTGGLMLVGGVTYRRMLNDAADSPIVSIAGSRNQWVGMGGLALTF